MSWPLRLVDDLGLWFASKTIGYMYTDGRLPPLVPIFPMMSVANAALVGALAFGVFIRGVEFVLPLSLSIGVAIFYWRSNREHLAAALKPWSPELHMRYNERARAARVGRGERLARLVLAVGLVAVIYGLDRAALHDLIKWELYVMVIYVVLWAWHSYAVAADLPAYEPNDPFYRADEVSR